ncbi:MAG: hypothetical protein JWO20_1552 [Candidatus Angelobacter sp.]|jgi:type IV pilus assembly protein PilA|nr:hypothetical protein [Candidatus Angelobacter sp.]
MKSALGIRELTRLSGPGESPSLMRISRESTAMSKQKGFSLVELLIVVAIILTLAAVAIPNLLRARMAANQASAVGSIHAITTANMYFESTFGGFAPSLPALGGGRAVCGSGNIAPAINAACLIDPSLSQATTPETAKSGYYFTYTGSNERANGTVQTFEILASPAVQNSTGELAFQADPWQVVPQAPISAGSSASAPKADTAPSGAQL